MAPTFLAPQWERANYMNLFAEPDDHGIGRSRGGLSTKIHALVDGRGRPLVLLVARGQGGDGPMFTHLTDQLKINRAGRPRTRPDRVRGDKAYSSKAIRAHLLDRGIVAVTRNHPTRPVIENEVDPGAADLRLSTERTGNPLRQTRAHLSWRSSPPGNQHLADSFRRHALAPAGRGSAPFPPEMITIEQLFKQFPALWPTPWTDRSVC
ncbi:transposase [Pseudarthrobacter sp. NamB4]|nr:transposase [Pseudarthrobacter sp. NamB4]